MRGELLGKISGFILIFIIMGFLPVFIRFSVIEHTSDFKTEWRVVHEVTNFYDSVLRVRDDTRLPPKSLAIGLNVVLSLIYTGIVYSLIIFGIKIYRIL
ncbi:hypothetical protein GF386_01600 [Candidatus Pacearchaeota archaeon]|nr:hypothetical protein [Candidatus Pacearchaeota archaeon]MBD3282875.1 hypothetical protein [Candidatus Pacearchaeota archaeon]